MAKEGDSNRTPSKEEDRKEILSAEDLIELAQVQSSALQNEKEPNTSADEDAKHDGEAIPTATGLHRGQRFVPRGAFATGGTRPTSNDTLSFRTTDTTEQQQRPHPIEAILVRDDGRGGEEYDDNGNEDDASSIDIYTAEPMSVFGKRTSAWSPQAWAYCGLGALALLSVIAVSIAVIVILGQRRQRNNNKPPPRENGEDSMDLVATTTAALTNESTTTAEPMIFTHHTTLFGSVWNEEEECNSAENADPSIDDRLQFKIRCSTPRAILHLYPDEEHLEELAVEIEARSEDEIFYSIPPNRVVSIAFDCEQFELDDDPFRNIAMVQLVGTFNATTACSVTAIAHVRTRQECFRDAPELDPSRCRDGSDPVFIDATLNDGVRGPAQMLVCAAPSTNDDAACEDMESPCIPQFGVVTKSEEDGCAVDTFLRPLVNANTTALARQAAFVAAYIREDSSSNRARRTTADTRSR